MVVLLQQQLGSFQTQVDKRRDLLEMTETNLKSKITHLESQLSRSRDTVNSQVTMATAQCCEVENSVGILN